MDKCAVLLYHIVVHTFSVPPRGKHTFYFCVVFLTHINSVMSAFFASDDCSDHVKKLMGSSMTLQYVKHRCTNKRFGVIQGYDERWLNSILLGVCYIHKSQVFQIIFLFYHISMTDKDVHFTLYSTVIFAKFT